jgi:hypothetical protein
MALLDWSASVRIASIAWRDNKLSFSIPRMRSETAVISFVARTDLARFSTTPSIFAAIERTFASISSAPAADSCEAFSTSVFIRDALKAISFICLTTFEKLPTKEFTCNAVSASSSLPFTGTGVVKSPFHSSSSGSCLPYHARYLLKS